MAVVSTQHLSEDRSQKLYNTHSHQACYRIENREHRPLIRIVGQTGLTGAGTGCLERIAYHVQRVKNHEAGIAQPHQIIRHNTDAEEHDQSAGDHNQIPEDHKGTEFPESPLGPVNQRADDGIHHRVKETHGRHDCGGEHQRQPQYAVGVVGDKIHG